MYQVRKNWAGLFSTLSLPGIISTLGSSHEKPTLISYVTLISCFVNVIFHDTFESSIYSSIYENNFENNIYCDDNNI